MKNLNLAFPDRSDIKFEHRHYPDGQQDIIILDELGDEPVQIMTRFTSFMDYEKIVAATASLRRRGVEDIYLYCPYILGGRSDIDFTKGKGGNNYLIDVIKPLIDMLEFKKVVAIDPHSPVMGALLRFRPLDNSELVRWAIEDIANSYMVMISPDAGADKKIHDIIPSYAEFELVTAAKHRDIQTGKFLGFNVPLLPHHLDKDLVWVDDICDGGGTFIGEAEQATMKGHKGKKYLIVTHGVFSQGFAQLTKHFDGIYCTNSYSNVGDISGNGMEKTKVKQMDVFI